MEKPISLFQLIATRFIHPPERVMMYVPISTFRCARSKDLLVRARHRYLSRDGAVLVKPVAARCLLPRSGSAGFNNRSYSNWRWHWTRCFVADQRARRINLWRAVITRAKCLEVFGDETAEYRKAALTFSEAAANERLMDNRCDCHRTGFGRVSRPR